MPLTTRPPRKHPELEALVRDNVYAKLLNWKLTEEDGGTLEQVFVVVWQRDDGECGTHRAVINYELGESMLVWGHYFRGPDAYHKAYVDWCARIANHA